MMDVSPEAQRTWPTTPRGKLMCPVCGASGYPSGASVSNSWVVAHVSHSTAKCAKVVSTKGLKAHEGRCKLCLAL